MTTAWHTYQATEAGLVYLYSQVEFLHQCPMFNLAHTLPQWMMNASLCAFHRNKHHNLLLLATSLVVCMYENISCIIKLIILIHRIHQRVNNNSAHWTCYMPTSYTSYIQLYLRKNGKTHTLRWNTHIKNPGSSFGAQQGAGLPCIVYRQNSDNLQMTQY